MKHPKIATTHTSRNAYIYVRQSTEAQVQNHLESQERQYELRDLAHDLGWPRELVIVIDADLGRSASTRSGRSGFARLVSDVALGMAGIVFGLEVSRLARNNRDWYQLLDLCSLRGTLIADAEGIYDPGDYNDRLLLGLKGTMSEAELHILRGRMLAGLRHKAKKGELRFHLPPGYEFDHEGRISKTSDEQAAHFVQFLFAKFFELGTISGLTKHLLHHDLLFPRKAAYDARVRWVRPYYRAVYTMLNNPIYAGTYVFGRSKVVTDINEQGERSSRQKSKPMRDWDVVIHDHHPAYITWDQFSRAQKIMERNRPAQRDQSSSILREGAALLQGLVRCGRCGRSMTVDYHSDGHGRAKAHPYYCCLVASTHSRRAACQTTGGRRIDQAVSQIFLEELSVARTEFHLAALRDSEQPQDDVLKQLELQLERARYEAERCERQYNAVEPENRIVARTLEKRWNDALAHAAEIEHRIEQQMQRSPLHLTAEQELVLRELVNDLPRLWSLPSISAKDRKALLRSVIDEVQLLKQDRAAHIKIVWKGGAVTEKLVELPRLAPRAAPPDLVQLIRDLATRHTDAQIARVLVRRAIKTPMKGLAFTAEHVCSIRHNHHIPCYQAPSDEAKTLHTVDQAARLFDVNRSTIYGWLRSGLLKGEQVTAGAPWSIEVAQQDLTRLGQSSTPHGWLPLTQAATNLGVTKQTVLNWVKAGKIPFVFEKRGRRSGLRIDVKSAPSRRQIDLLHKADISGGAS